ncbi:MAG: ABC transporter permease, partial [Deltaproteobacteria bacterium]|nr:ABC transporter permease [Deltaproteobacteria bacterium]
NPYRYLVVPNLLAGIIALPLLTAIFDVIGIMGGYLVGVELLGLESGVYFGEMANYVGMDDIMEGVYKSLCFGVIISWVSCYKGYYTGTWGYGAEGVSKATTQAVVMSSVFILIWDYFMTSMLSFDDNNVFKGVSLTVETGEILALIGRSGIGKSVLLRHIVGLIKPDSGRVLVEGEDICRLRSGDLQQLRRRLGLLFQGGALFDSMTVFDNVAFPLREKTVMSEEEISEKVMTELEHVGLSGTEERYPSQLSGGMRKRAALAREIVWHPEIMLFDEPTTGLDPVISNAILNLIDTLHKRLNFTGIIVTHEVPEVFRIVDKVAMLHEGVIVAVGTPEEVLSSQNPIVQQFIKGETEGPISYH